MVFAIIHQFVLLIKSNIDKSGIFSIKYDGNALLWKQLVALDKDNNEIWSVNN